MSADSTLGWRTPWPRPKWRVEPKSAIRWWDANKIIHFLKSLVTGDEKWIVYNNVRWKNHGKILPIHQKKPKTELHQKVILSIWWNWKGILYYEHLPANKTIKSDIYCEQFDNLKEEFLKCPEMVNRRGIVFRYMCIFRMIIKTASHKQGFISKLATRARGNRGENAKYNDTNDISTGSR